MNKQTLATDKTGSTFMSLPLTRDILLDYIQKGCKQKGYEKIGLEVEHFVYDKNTGQALSYEGERGVRTILEHFIKLYGWQPIYEKENIIALQKGRKNITLEPAGQIEISGEPLSTPLEVKEELYTFRNQLDHICSLLDLDVLNKGFHPYWKREDIHWMPKARYGIMCNYMPKVGTLGLDMMTRTCTAQVNLDYFSEEDMVKKYRLAVALQPMLIGLYANSSMVEGVDTGYKSYRTKIWLDTDADRWSMLPFVFEDGFGFERILDYILDVPMYFLKRNDIYHNVAGESFRDLMQGKLKDFEGEHATLKDFEDQITVNFPPVRLKRFLEIREADSNTPEKSVALAALWAGLFYDETVLDTAYNNVLGKWKFEDFKTWRYAVPKAGLELTIAPNYTLADLAKEIIALSREGTDNLYGAETTKMLDVFEN